jgi:hypothetical protein
MGGGTSRPQPEIRTYVGGELAEVTESTDGMRRSVLRSEKSNYSVPGTVQPESTGSGKLGLQVDAPDPDSPGHLSEAATTPSESPGGTWTDPTAGHMTPNGQVNAATSPGGVPGGVKTLKPLPKTVDPLSKMDSRRTSLIDGSVEAELAALRAELVSQRKATEALAAETRAMKSQLNSQLANLTHIVMAISASGDASGKSRGRRGDEDGDGASPESSGGVSSNGPSPAVRNRSKSEKQRGRRMSLNALTTAGV